MSQKKQRRVMIGIALVVAAAVVAASPLWAFTVPTPTGFKVLYMFTGARDANGIGANSSATVVHCTNYDVSKTASLIIEFADFDNDPIIQVPLTIAPQVTQTVSSQDTVFYAEDATATLTDDLNQGSVAVFGDRSSKKTICTAVVLDPLSDPPVYIHTLTAFDGRGKF